MKQKLSESKSCKVNVELSFLGGGGRGREAHLLIVGEEVGEWALKIF